MSWIDTHCHLEKFTHAGELEATLRRAAEAGVHRMITVGTEPSDWTLYRDMAMAHPGVIDFTIGLHPCSVDNDWESALATLPTFFESNPRPAALGEIGLDYYHLPKDPEATALIVERQHAALAAQLAIAARLDCPIVVHSRGAFEDCVKVIEASDVRWERVVFHCFGDGPKEVARLNTLGGWASFTGIVTYKNAETTREALRRQGPERLMLETDAPYLAPVPHRGKRNEPAFISHIGEYCARLLDMDAQELSALTTANAEHFFNPAG